MKVLLRIFLVLIGLAVGPGLLALVFEIMRSTGTDLEASIQPLLLIAIYAASSLVTGIIIFLLSKRISDKIYNGLLKIEDEATKVPAYVVAGAIAGLIAGLIIAALLSWAIGMIPLKFISLPLTVIVYLACGFLGIRIGSKNAGIIVNLRTGVKESSFRRKATSAEWEKERNKLFGAKILDTSVIIDGRIVDVLKTGIIEGTVVVPEFVLGELQHIADSADSLKRSKGRRGLDIVAQMQRELSIPVEITDKDYEDTPEVDLKLLKLAKETGGKVLTNDFNLNKVAAVQGVPVFNINDLANAVKPVLIPGEKIKVSIIKEGKEHGQGVAYLEDGTMIVVENGRESIGSMQNVVVTSVLQTSAGRMIFARI